MADAFSTLPVRTDNDGDVVVGIATGEVIGITGTVNVAVTSALPTGSNTIGNVGITGALPTGSNTIGNVGITGALPAGSNNIGSVNIGSALPTGSNTIGNVGITGALPTGSNTIGNVGITGALPTGSNTIGNVGITGALPAGSNIIGKVEIVASSGTMKHVSTPTSGNVIKNGGTATVAATNITSGTTGELVQITVASSVAMKAIMRKNNTITPVNVCTVYIPAGGGQQTIAFPSGSVTQAGTVAGEHFDVVFTNLDTKNDAEATATFSWAEV